MAASIFRSISRKAATESLTRWRSVAASSAGSVNRFSFSTTAATISPPPSSLSPWLMLPPAVERGSVSYNFYNLADSKVLTFSRTAAASAAGEEDADLHSDLLPVGSSHGWLVYFNVSNRNLFLYNPLTNRRVNLPPMPEEATSSGSCLCKCKVVISCSPDDDERGCRAVMCYRPEGKLAFCWPGHSSDWTHIGAPFFDYDGEESPRVYEDVVYSNKHQSFFCVTYYNDFEEWDLRDPTSPKLTQLGDDNTDVDRENYPFAQHAPVEGLNCLKRMCEPLKYLVIAPNHPKALFVVTRYIKLEYIDNWVREEGKEYPHKTMWFDVHKYDVEANTIKYLTAGYAILDGLAIFVGSNQTFALPESKYPQLKPNSIYFTDAYARPLRRKKAFSGHDIGIYDYEDLEIPSCYYPSDF